MKRFGISSLLAVSSLLIFARTGSVHDDFVIWLVPSVFLFLLWSGYKIKELWLRRKEH